MPKALRRRVPARPERLAGSNPGGLQRQRRSTTAFRGCRAVGTREGVSEPHSPASFFAINLACSSIARYCASVNSPSSICRPALSSFGGAVLIRRSDHTSYARSRMARLLATRQLRSASNASSSSFRSRVRNDGPFGRPSGLPLCPLGQAGARFGVFIGAFAGWEAFPTGLSSREFTANDRSAAVASRLPLERMLTSSCEFAACSLPSAIH